MAKLLKIPLTEHQRKTLQFIVDFIDQNGYPPKIVEILEGVGYNNPGYVHKILSYLEKKGYIVRIKGSHRGIRLTEISENLPTSNQLSFFDSMSVIGSPTNG
ncbi:MAG: hypothetical protein ABSA46_20345 [Thermodesulfovibrionales bacterium]|jgi:repressor LexA